MGSPQDAVGAWTLAVVGAYLAARRFGRRRFRDGTFARRRPARELPPDRFRRGLVRAGQPPQGTLLGLTAAGRPAVVPDAAANAGVCVYAATGGGKTSALTRFAASAMRRGLPLVLVDGKGDAGWAARLAGLAAANGRELRQWSAQGRLAWDPLADASPSQVRDALMAATGPWTEPYYKEIAARYLQAVARAAASAGEALTLGRALELLESPRATDRLLRRAAAPAAETADAILTSLETDKGAQSGVAGLAHRLGNLVESDAGAWLNGGGNLLREALAEVAGGPPVVLFSLPKLRYPQLVPQLGALALLALKFEIAARYGDGRGGLRRPAFLLLDEFGAFAGAEALNLLNQARGAGICTVLATQSRADAAAADRTLPAQIDANTAVKLIGRTDDPDEAEHWARTFGTRPGWQVTHQVDHVLGRPTGRGSVRAGDEFIVHPQALKELRPLHFAVSVKVPRAEVWADVRVPVGGEVDEGRPV